MKGLSLILFGLFFAVFDVISVMFSVGLFLIFLVLKGFGFAGLFYFDSFSLPLLYMTFLIFFFCFFSSISNEASQSFNYGYHFCLFVIFFLLFVSFTCLSVFLFYLCFEVIFLIMYFFVLTWGYSPERLQASLYMVFYTLVVSFPFLVYLFFSWYQISSFNFVGFYHFSSYWFYFLFFVFLVKLPAYGVHLWLPKVHVEAPISGSMVLAGVLLKLGGYGMFRLLCFVPSFLSKSGYFFSLGLLGSLISCVVCLRQSDLKAFVAYSSVCHMGFCLIGIFGFSFFGWKGSMQMLVAHGFCSSCLFYILFILYERFKTRSILMLKSIVTMGTILSFFLFFVSILNMGVPPSLSFFSEIFILAGSVQMSLSAISFCGVFVLLEGIYCIYLFVSVCLGASNSECLGIHVSVREYLIMSGHVLPLLSFPFVYFYFV